MQIETCNKKTIQITSSRQIERASARAGCAVTPPVKDPRRATFRPPRPSCRSTSHRFGWPAGSPGMRHGRGMHLQTWQLHWIPLSHFTSSPSSPPIAANRHCDPCKGDFTSAQPGPPRASLRPLPRTRVAFRASSARSVHSSDITMVLKVVASLGFHGCH